MLGFPLPVGGALHSSVCNYLPILASIASPLLLRCLLMRNIVLKYKLFHRSKSYFRQKQTESTTWSRRHLSWFFPDSAPQVVLCRICSRTRCSWQHRKHSTWLDTNLRAATRMRFSPEGRDFRAQTCASLRNLGNNRIIIRATIPPARFLFNRN